MFPQSEAETKQAILSVIHSVPGTTVSSFNDTSQFDFFAELQARLSRGDGSIVILIPAVAILGWKLLRRTCSTLWLIRGPAHLMANMFRSFAGRPRSVRHESNRRASAVEVETFMQALKMDRVVGMRSYNILANPAYQRLFYMQHEGNDDAPRASTGDPDGLASARTPKSFGSFQTLQDALNLKRAPDGGSKSVMGDDHSSQSDAKSATTTKLYRPKSGKSVKKDDDNMSVASNKSGKDDVPDDMRTVVTSQSSKVRDAIKASSSEML